MPSPSDVNEDADSAPLTELRADGVELVAGSITDLAGVVHVGSTALGIRPSD